MALTSFVTSLRISTFLTSGNPRVSVVAMVIHAAPPTVARYTMTHMMIQGAPPTSEHLSSVEVNVWASLDQAFFAGDVFGGPEVFAPDFFVEPIFESPEPPEVEVNPYRPAEANADLQQILREQHMVQQAGDSTFHWGVLTDIYNEPLYNLGSLGKFYHDDLGIIHARYCRFVDFNLTDGKAAPVGLRKPSNLPWTVTNQISLSDPNAVLGVAIPYDTKVNIGTWYGWVITEGFIPAEIPVAISNKKFPFGTEYGWSANGTIAQELDSNSVGYRVRIDNDPRMQPGAFYVHTDRSSLGRANGLITTRLAPLVSDIDGLDTRLGTLETTVAGHTLAITELNKKHDDFVVFMTKEVKNLSDALNAIRALMPDGNFKTYVDTSVAALKQYVDTSLTVVGGVANAGLARANEAYALAQSISYAGIQTQIDAINSAMGGITNRIIGFKTTIDTNMLDEGQVLVSYLYNTDADGVKYFDFRPVDFVLENLLNVDMVTTPPTHGDSLVWDGVNSKWVPYAVSGGGGGGIPEAPTDSITYGRNNAAWVPLGLWAWSAAGGSVSTSSSSVKGFNFSVPTAITIDQIAMMVDGHGVGTPVNYTLYLVTMNNLTAAGTISTILHTGSAHVVNAATGTYNGLVDTLSSPITLTPGTVYGVLPLASVAVNRGRHSGTQGLPMIPLAPGFLAMRGIFMSVTPAPEAAYTVGNVFSGAIHATL